MRLVEELRVRESYLTTKEVMQLLRCRRNTLCRWVRNGRMSAIRSGTGYLFDPRHLAEWLTKRSTSRDRRAA
jgi:excisionase family DNA binding protein